MRPCCALVTLAIFLTACGEQRPALAPTPVWLLPLPSATPSPAVTPRPATATPPPTFTPTATPTPVTYVIQKGDTLGGIAYTYGISLEVLQAANPKVQPAFLTIGTVLTIPVPAGGLPAPGAVQMASPTPWAVTLAAGPVCHPLVTGALYCFVEVHNPGGGPVHHVLVQLTLVGPKGETLASDAAATALDVIPAGGSAPLAVWFPSATPGLTAPVAQVLSAESAPAAEVPLEVSTGAGSAPQGAGAGAAWTVTGQVHNASTAAASSVKLVLTLYGSDGKILNYRQATQAEALAAGASRDFSISALPLGGTVDHYAIVAEGQP